ncbi:MAG: hypothetical protein RXN31_02085 [Candidatus Nanopusillus acidilobi]
MKGDSLIKIIFDIIVLIVLVIFIFYIITALIGLAMGEDFEYIGYLNSIADAINSNNNANGQIFIDNYDYNYVFVLTYNNGWYLQLYHCFPPNFVVGLLSVKLVYWNVSTTNNGDIVFAPSLAFCKLIKQRLLNNNIDQISITMQGLNDNAGLLVLDANDNLNRFIINMPLTDNFFSYNSLAILNDTNITCNNSECTYTSSSTGESGNIYCAPYPNMNSNSLTYNPLVCVELSGFPQNSQVQLSNLEGEIVDASTLGSLFQEDFPLLYFAGSLPPTVMYIDVNSNDGTADINIYIGETVA